MRLPRESVYVGLVVCSLGLGGCEGTTPKPVASPSPVAQTKPSLNSVEGALSEATERDRVKYASLSFEDFKKSKAVYKEPFEGGKYIVNGDTTIANEKQLQEFFEKKVKVAPPPKSALIVSHISGLDQAWNQESKLKIAYCVSKSGFAQRYNAVVTDMEAATGAWQQVAAVAFAHDAAQDEHCDASNQAVVFDVRPVDVGGEYLARAFFPNEPRAERNVLIDKSALTLGPTEKPQLVGILRHELGHSLGFRHEQTRPSAGTCFEDSDWRVLTEYDPYSVMHYPQCNGKGDWSLTLTDRDKSGAACLYGPASGFTIDPALVDLPKCNADKAAPTGSPKTESVDGASVQKGKANPHGPYAVVPGSLFVASMGGAGATGDPDLYVRFDEKPGLDAYDCRPYLVGPNETCSINVPAGKTQAFVMVQGYEAGKYGLKIIYVPPSH